MIRFSFLLILFVGLLSNELSGQQYEQYKKLLDTTFVSKQLGFEKKITITVPFTWQKDLQQAYPLIVVFDRQNQRSHNYILNSIDYLTSNEQMPASILVSIESSQEHRYFETLHKTSAREGLAAENEKFLFEELIPWLEKDYHASDFRLFIGHSRYGYFTSSLLFSRTNELNAVISMSPFFQQKNVSFTDSMAVFKKRNFKSPKYYRFGIGNDYPADYFKMSSALKELNQPQFDSKGYLFKEADHNATPGLTIAVALYEIFEAWSKVQSRYYAYEENSLTAISALDDEIKEKYGSKLGYALGVLNGKGWYFYNKGEFEKAIAAWEILMKSYPNFSEGYLYIMDAQIQLKSDYSETVKRFSASLNSSTFYTEAEKEELLQELKKSNK